MLSRAHSTAPSRAPRATAPWLALALLPTLALGCGGSSTDPARSTDAPGDVAVGGESPVPEAPLDPLTLLPSDAVAVVDVDVASLRDSPHAERLLAWMADMLDDPSTARLVRDLLERTHHLVIGLTPPGGSGAELQGVLVARGDLDSEALPELVPDGATVELDAETGRAVHLHENVAATALDDGTWLFASGDRIGPALERAHQRPVDGGPLADPDLAAMAERVGLGGPGITVVAHASAGIRDRMGDDRYFARSTAEALRVLGVAIRMEGGVDVELVAETRDADSARALAARALELTRWAGSHAVVGLMGLRPLFDGARIRSDDTRAILMLHLEDAFVAELLSRAEMLSGRLQELGTQEGAPEAAQAPSD